MKRTTRSFPAPENFWPTVEEWAKANGYVYLGSVGHTHTFEKLLGFAGVWVMLQLQESNGVIDFQAWMRFGTWLRILSFCLLPVELPLESGGFKAIMERKFARKGLNQLLTQFGQPPIS